MGEYLKKKEKEGHIKTKTKFKKPDEDAAVYDLKKVAGGIAGGVGAKAVNAFAKLNRHLIKKLQKAKGE